jgi:hypothetical protein
VRRAISVAGAGLVALSGDPFYKLFRIMGFAGFSWHIPASKEVMCLTILNHVLTRRVLACMGLAPPALCSLCWTMMELIWSGSQGQMSQMGLWKTNFGHFLGLNKKGLRKQPRKVGQEGYKTLRTAKKISTSRPL